MPSLEKNAVPSAPEPVASSPAPATAGAPIAPRPLQAPQASDAPGTRSGHTPVHVPPRTGIWMLLLAVLLALGLGIGFYFVNHRRTAAEEALREQTDQAADAPMDVDVVKVLYSPATRVLPLPGECSAWYETTLYARVSGYVKKWNVDIGDHVKAGEVLATIETPELDQQLTSDEAKLQACKAQIALAKANAHFSQVTLARYKDAPKGVVSDLERDEKAADEQVSNARLAAAQSDLASAQADVDRLQTLLAFKQVLAPFDGVITQRRVDIGNLVSAGSASTTTPLFVVAQSDHIRVFVSVPESAAVEIHDGDRAIATADEFPDRQFIGRVSRTSRAINDASKTLRVEVDIPNQDLSLLPGMFVRVNFQVKDTEPTLVIPASAINFRSGGPEVATVSDDGHVTFRDVTIARDLGDSIEIKHGLKPDDRVALNISYQIANGDIVKPNEVSLSGSQAAPLPPTKQATAPRPATKSAATPATKFPRLSLDSH